MKRASRRAPAAARKPDLGEAPGALEVRRGDILWFNCDPSLGAEPRKTRTCVVVSNDIANRFGQVLTVIPTQSFTTERAERAYMADLRRPRSTLEVDRVANASMVMTYDRARVVARAGRVTAAGMRPLEQALAMHLGLATREG